MVLKLNTLYTHNHTKVIQHNPLCMGSDLYTGVFGYFNQRQYSLLYFLTYKWVCRGKGKVGKPKNILEWFIVLKEEPCV